MSLEDMQRYGEQQLAAAVLVPSPVIGEAPPPWLRLVERGHITLAELVQRDALMNLQEELDLTDIEMLRVLLDHEQTITKWMLRAERHPDQPDRKADEE